MFYFTHLFCCLKRRKIRNLFSKKMKKFFNFSGVSFIYNCKQNVKPKIGDNKNEKYGKSSRRSIRILGK